jgi:hypothetical protein
MKKRLTIGTPCHEDWNKMTPNDEGRHCDVCNKTVVDLTAKTQPEMVALFESKGGDMCGVMMVPTKAVPALETSSRPALRGRLRNFALALLAALGFISFSALRAEAQNVPLPGAVAYVASADFSATVIANGKPVSGAQVQVKRGNVLVKELVTNQEGKVSFDQLDWGAYTVVVRWESQKMGSREIQLSHESASETFFFQKVDGRWQEALPHMLLGDTIMVQEHVKGKIRELKDEEVQKVGLVEEEVVRTVGEPMLVEEPLLMGKPVLCTDKSAEGAQKVTPQPPTLDLKVFPNPMDGLFRAEILGTHKGDGVHLTVFDANGKFIHSETHEGGEDLMLEVDLSEAASGIYFVKVVHGDAVLEKRVVRL